MLKPASTKPTRRSKERNEPTPRRADREYWLAKESTMKSESVAIANTLLRRHTAICRPLGRRGPDDVDNDDINHSTISYSDLCDQAGLGREFAIACKDCLFEIAERCEERGWPPINALAVNATSLYPGGGYSEAPGCRDWPNDVKRVIAF